MNWFIITLGLEVVWLIRVQPVGGICDGNLDLYYDIFGKGMYSLAIIL